MSITVRSYKDFEDFIVVSNFLTEIYEPGVRYGNWLQPRWEYMHFHPNLNESVLDRIGIWEDSGTMVGLATYEDQLGDAYFSLHPDYTYLKAEMLEYAERHLFKTLDNGRGLLRAFINDFDLEFQSIARSRGYKQDESFPEFRTISSMSIPDPFPVITLPAGFQLKSLDRENDLNKINRVLWRGFNHPGEPPEEELAGREKMQSAPNYRPDLTMVVEAPDGNFVAFSGIWYVPENRLAYIEPVATDPNYRRMGLGKAAVLECIRRSHELGAEVVIVESGQKFYESIGFKKVFARYPWVRMFDL